MSSGMSKRQQARNERALQDLIKTVPGNDRCADCGERNPGWASWSLGIFLCLRCAALHRKLGTHISKVKSLTMDSWNNEQVENMRKVGNVASNRHFNPQNARPSIPIDVDEVDGAMERFIRQKYDQRQRPEASAAQPSARHNTGSTSSEDRPTVQPQKSSRRFGFGFRSSSSQHSSKHITPASPSRPRFDARSATGSKKASRLFGSNIGGSDASLDSKLTVLKDMGFQDEKRNLTVLRGVDGDLDRAVEALIKLGERSRDQSRSRATEGSSTRTADSPNHSAEAFDSASNSRVEEQHPPQNQSAQSQQPGALHSTNPFLASTQPPRPSFDMSQSLQALDISQQPQRLFPNSTGGYGAQPFAPNNPYLTSLTPPPMPTAQQPYLNNAMQASTFQPPQRVFSSPLGTVAPQTNPFLRSSRSQIFHPSNPYEQQATPNPNPYAAQLPQQTGMQQTGFQQSLPQPSHSLYGAASNNFGYANQQTFSQAGYQPQSVQANPQPSPAQNFFQQPMPQQTILQTQTWPVAPPEQPPPRAKADKASILALYNQPQLAPLRPAETTGMHPPDGHNVSNSNAVPTQQLQRSATEPAIGPNGVNVALQEPKSLNPFVPSSLRLSPATAQGASMNTVVSPISPAGPSPLSQSSRESVDFAGLMNGRHSPDAFAGLSARYVR